MKLPCESAKQNHRPQGGLVQQCIYKIGEIVVNSTVMARFTFVTV
jgi:hypothetical protein